MHILWYPVQSPQSHARAAAGCGKSRRTLPVPDSVPASPDALTEKAFGCPLYLLEVEEEQDGLNAQTLGLVDTWPRETLGLVFSTSPLHLMSK